MAPTPSSLTASGPEAIWAELRAPVWKPFRLETGCFLLHVPTSHLLEVDLEVLLHVTGEKPDPEIEEQLAEVVEGFPKPQPRRVETDIQSVSLNMAQGCNLRCTYCFAGEGDYGVKGMMSFETAKAVLEFFAKGRERFHVTFFGGEPMLNFDVIKQIVGWAKEQTCRYTFAITTNGTLLNDEKLQFFKQHRFSITWSYDGKGLQDRQRLMQDKKTGSNVLVERKLKAFEGALSELRDFKLRTTVSRENLDVAEEAIVDTLTANTFKLLISRHATALRSQMFTMADVETLGAILRRVVDRLLIARDYSKLMRLGGLSGQIRAIHRGATGQLACGAGVDYLSVSTEGAFYLCHRFAEDESERFGDVQSGLDANRLAEIREARHARRDPCGSCWVREWCAGGCFHEHKAATGDKFTVDPTFCKLQSLETELAIRVYTTLLRDAPELLEA